MIEVDDPDQRDPVVIDDTTPSQKDGDQETDEEPSIEDESEIVDPEVEPEIPVVPVKPYTDDFTPKPIPVEAYEYFSWVDQMPECLGTIEDQGECGSCWAFTSSGLLADRFCIHSKGSIKTRLSPQEMVNCNYENFGC